MDGVLETVRPVFGLKYTFFFSPDGKLVIQEVDDTRGVELELLHGTREGVQTWGAELPERLRTMHSHWHCREKGTVVLRDIPFNERSAHFVLVHAGEVSGSDSDSGFLKVSPRSDTAGAGAAPASLVDRAGTGDWLCCRVPLHLQQVHSLHPNPEP